MRPAEPDTNETVRVLPASRRRRAAWPLAMAAVIGAALAGSAAFWLLRSPPPPLPPAAATSMPVASAPAFQIKTATEAEISRARHDRADRVPLRRQSARSWCWISPRCTSRGRCSTGWRRSSRRRGLPHDRVLTDSELDAAIQRAGRHGRDVLSRSRLCRRIAGALLRAGRPQRIELDPLEEKLRALLRQEGWFAADVAARLDLIAGGRVRSADHRRRYAPRSCATNFRTASSSAVPPMRNTCAGSG